VAFIEDDLSDLLPTLDRLLEDNEHREQIAAQAQAFALRHHTHINRAQELLAWIEKLR
jgi:spore maturation protein CgeB